MFVCWMGISVVVLVCLSVLLVFLLSSERNADHVHFASEKQKNPRGGRRGTAERVNETFKLPCDNRSNNFSVV